MFSRLLLRRLQALTLIPPPPLRPPPTRIPSTSSAFRSLSTAPGGGHDGTWKLTPENPDLDSLFGRDHGDLSGISETKENANNVADLNGDDVWETAKGYTPWTIGGDDSGKGGGIFGGEGEGGGDVGIEGIDGEGVDLTAEETRRLEEREMELKSVLKGPDRAFGDLIAQSGITEDMIDSLILLKETRGVKGLPPLEQIEDEAIERLNATSSRAEIERKKQEEIAESRVKKVDEKGRAYGTGRRKCSIARVWVTPGSGKFIVNDKEFDAYFPILDHRAELLRPFNATNTLGLWDVDCTVKGGGVSGQVGAIRLGVSRALENWEPGFRPYLKSVGYLTRDSRIVERKKPGQAKARKKFQWVKR